MKRMMGGTTPVALETPFFYDREAKEAMMHVAECKYGEKSCYDLVLKEDGEIYVRYHGTPDYGVRYVPAGSPLSVCAKEAFQRVLGGNGFPTCDFLQPMDTGYSCRVQVTHQNMAFSKKMAKFLHPKQERFDPQKSFFEKNYADGKIRVYPTENSEGYPLNPDTQLYNLFYEFFMSLGV